MQSHHEYEPLLGEHHVRVLEITKRNWDVRRTGFELTLGQIQVGGSGPTPQKPYECISYVWAGTGGMPTPLRLKCTESSEETGWILRLGNAQGSVSITTSLAEALPHLCRNTKTGRIWIDQLCINQVDMDERASQVARMGNIYSSAVRTIVWLGSIPRDLKYLLHHSEPPPPDSSRLRRNRETRILVPLHSIFVRSWFSRGWIVQEYCMAQQVDFIFEKQSVPSSDLVRLARSCVSWNDGAPMSVPAKDYLFINSIRDELVAKQHICNASDALPEQMRRLWILADHFETTKEQDCLLAYLGLIPAIKYRPNCHLGFEHTLIDFAISCLEQSGRLDFLAYVHPENRVFSPSWAPTWRRLDYGPRYEGPDYTKADPDMALFGSPLLQWQAWPTDRTYHIKTTLSLIDSKGRLHVRGRLLGDVVIISRRADGDTSPSDANAIMFLGANLAHEKFDYLKVVWHCFQVPGGLSWEECRRQDLEDQRRNMKKRFEALGESNREIIKVGGGKLGIASLRHTQRKCFAVVLQDCFVPLLLRPSSEDPGCHRIVCSAYVEGAMHGEAVTDHTKSLQDFTLV